MTSHHITSHHVTSRHITSHHITSRHVTSRHITSHHITSHRQKKHKDKKEKKKNGLRDALFGSSMVLNTRTYVLRRGYIRRSLMMTPHFLRIAEHGSKTPSHCITSHHVSSISLKIRSRKLGENSNACIAGPLCVPLGTATADFEPQIHQSSNGS